MFATTVTRLVILPVNAPVIVVAVVVGAVVGEVVARNATTAESVATLLVNAPRTEEGVEDGEVVVMTGNATRKFVLIELSE